MGLTNEHVGPKILVKYMALRKNRSSAPANVWLGNLFALCISQGPFKFL